MTGITKTLFFRAVLAAMLAGVGHSAWALGLGQARASSYLQQPLDLRIDLISRSEAELATVTAGMASAADFRVMGLSTSAVGLPLEFTIDRDLEDPHIRVRSREPMMEPVLQLVIEVVWASGRMVRQYTVFLDPPTFESAAPLPQVDTPAPGDAPATREAVDDPVTADTGPPFDPMPETESDPAPAPDPTPVSDPAPESGAVTATGPVEDDESPVAMDDDASVAESAAQTEPAETPALRTALPDPESATPGEHQVSRGETLWGLSTRWAAEQGVDVNQMMLAVQQRNPDAFNRGNINSLKAGTVLRVPDRPSDFTYDAREAMLEVLRQEQIYRNRWDIPTNPDDLPTVAELAQQPVSDDSPAAPAAEPDNDGRLELVPPSESVEDDEAAMGQGNTGETGVSDGESVVQELARAEEELANARQENEYLSERIRELEAELERSRAAVEDSGLAEMEDRLRENRTSAQDDEPVEVVPEDIAEAGYGRFIWWFVGGLVIIVIGLVWWLRSRSEDLPYDDASAEH